MLTSAIGPSAPPAPFASPRAPAYRDEKRRMMDTTEAVAYARKHALHALVIQRAGRAIERVFDDAHDGDTPHALYSGTKSFWGVAALRAQSDGILHLDEAVGATFPAWSRGERGGVTLRMLLQLTAGIGFGGLGASVPTYDRALEVPLKNPPGRTFTYGGIPLQVFGAVFAHKLASRNQTPHEYLHERVLREARVNVARWRTLKDGTKPLPTGAFVAADEWLKYGRYVAQHREEFAPCFEGSSANARYGLGWWLAPAGLPNDLLYASGSGGQALYAIPSHDLVVVHFGAGASFKHDAFLKRLLR